MVIRVSEVKVSITLSKICCKGANFVHQTCMKVGTTQPQNGTENENNTDDLCAPSRRHKNDCPPRCIVAAVLCVHVLVTCHWCLVLTGKGSQQIQEKIKHHQPVSRHQN